jgi:hypothetical protein
MGASGGSERETRRRQLQGRVRAARRFRARKKFRSGCFEGEERGPHQRQEVELIFSLGFVFEQLADACSCSPGRN